MKKVISLGEILLRLTPPQYQTLSQANSLECQFGGSELNVLATLAQLGHQVAMVSAIPDNDLGTMTQQFLFSKQIGQKAVIRKGQRLGLYYYQKGFSRRASRVTYDRKYSAFWESRLADYDVESLFEEADWFHVSGITPALTNELYHLTEVLMKKAKELGVTISFDLNFRESLWSSFQEARDLLSPLVALVDVCIGLEPIHLPSEVNDLKDELGLKAPYKDKIILLEVLEEICQSYQLKTIAFTQREMGYHNDYILKAYLYYQGKLYETTESPIQVLDRVGTGDAFTAGLIHAFLEGESAQKALDIAMACFTFKHTIEGDVNLISKEDIVRFMNATSFDVKR
ncbi:sugar kinase [Streptococcus iniae]|uniref:sugar kinase n=1 Tax=Streptococcus iniae TaxID=1346 RepID=UPI000B6199D5|nr:sugar kinase [Streptococcus iniae]ASL34467.1 PfkB family carbohydrate kinase [Streptococcus iniae]RLU55718.1 sugar kinase [Streptococcus iniae]RLU66410.1 sugar kinase [Streptococcus iniae]RLU67629.1 sugar kinase [Streptococcus iniae]RLU69232.1 sugar kinase [Streptococcus iniae]